MTFILTYLGPALIVAIAIRMWLATLRNTGRK